MRRRRSSEEKIRAAVLRRRRAADRNAKRRASFYTEDVEDIDRWEILERDEHACYLCGQSLSIHDMELDHVTPLCKGGSHTRGNVRAAHKVCNAKKGSELVSELDRSEW